VAARAKTGFRNIHKIAAKPNPGLESSYLNSGGPGRASGRKGASADGEESRGTRDNGSRISAELDLLFEKSPASLSSGTVEEQSIPRSENISKPV
jgi:hypothetical protein